MKILRGKQSGAKKVCVYGPEGIGKSTFASKFPKPLFIDTEGGTKEIDVERFEKPTSWQMISEQINYTKTHPTICKTLVIDTIDWAEMLCIEHICAKYQKEGLESFGYGTGYVYVREEFGRFLNSLEELIEKGINVVLTAHAQLRKFSQPDEIGEYDRWELKLGKKTGSQISPLVKEWADMVLFANYKTFAVAADKEGRKFKAQGGKRIMYTQHHPCWDAKNRNGLPEEIPFEYSQIRHIIEPIGSTQKPKEEPIVKIDLSQIDLSQTEEILSADGTIPDEKPDTKPYIPDGIPKALADLMTANNVSESDIQLAVSLKGYFPEGTPIANYPPDFVSGVLIGAWDQVYAMIKENKKIPF